MSFYSLLVRIKILFKSWKTLWRYAFGDEDIAISELEECIKLDPKNAPNLSTLGKIFINKEKYQDGLQRLEDALKYYPKKDKSIPEIHAYIAYAHFKLDRLDDSLRFYKRALEDWVKDGDFKKNDLFYAIGRIYLQKKQYGEAEDAFIEGLQLDENDANAHVGLGISCFEKGKKEESLNHLEKALGLDPTLAENETVVKLKRELRDNITLH